MDRTSATKLSECRVWGDSFRGGHARHRLESGLSIAGDIRVQAVLHDAKYHGLREVGRFGAASWAPATTWDEFFI